MMVPIRNGIMALARVKGAVCGDATDLLFGWDLIEQFRQHGRVADASAGELDGSDLQCLLVDPEVDFAPDPPFGTAMLARIPLAFTLDLDTGAWSCPRFTGHSGGCGLGFDELAGRAHFQP